MEEKKKKTCQDCFLGVILCPVNLFKGPQDAPKSSYHKMKNTNQSANIGVTHTGTQHIQQSNKNYNALNDDLSLDIPMIPKANARKSKKPKTGYVGWNKNSNSMILKNDSFCGPFSYLIYDATIRAEADAPAYLTLESVNAKKKTEKSEIFSGLKIDNGYLEVTDQEILNTQKGIITDVLKSLSQSLKEGRGVVGISLPVRIFEPISLVERICDWWSFAPTFLKLASEENDIYERFKYVLTFVISGLYVSASQRKPFNPLLGETFQGKFEDGTEIYVEHISHHPPISSFLVINKQFRLYGSYELCGNLSFNTLTVYPEGLTYVTFPDGGKIAYSMPICEISGMLFGKRTISYKGIVRMNDMKNNIKSVIVFGKGKTVDAFTGKIYLPKPGNQINKPNNIKKSDFESQESLIKDVEKLVSEVKGTYLEFLNIGDKTFWNINEHKPSRVYSIKHPLPSDARFREDLIWLKYKETDKAQDWKLALEKRQRYDKTLRLNKSKQNSLQH